MDPSGSSPHSVVVNEVLNPRPPPFMGSMQGKRSTAKLQAQNEKDWL